MVVLGGDGTILRGAEWVLASEIPLLGCQSGARRFPGRGGVVGDRQHRGAGRRPFLHGRGAIHHRGDAPGLRVRRSGLVLVRDQRGVDREGRARADARGAGRGRRPAAVSLGLRRNAGRHPDRLDRVRLLGRGSGDLARRGRTLVVPLSAHALFARPLVLGPTSTVVVEVLDVSPTHGVVWCDGRRSRRIATRGWRSK